MVTIGLIRHGVTDWNNEGKAQGLTDIPLNKDGRKQIQDLSFYLLNQNWEMICSSHLSRARESAEIIGLQLGLEVHFIDSRLREINCGKIEGLREEERVIKWGTHWRKQNLGMEEFAEVAKRGINFLEDMALKFPNKRLLAVSHGALIGLTLQHLLPEYFKQTYIDNASISILTKVNKQWNCELYNNTANA